MRQIAQIAAVLLLTAGSAAVAQDAEWPSERIASDGTRVRIYQPQIDTWDRYEELEFHMAAELTAPDRSSAIAGPRG